jgi:hypothetical protein
LCGAIEVFEAKKFSKDVLREHVKQFSPERFRTAIGNFVAKSQ